MARHDVGERVGQYSGELIFILRGEDDGRGHEYESAGKRDGFGVRGVVVEEGEGVSELRAAQLSGEPLPEGCDVGKRGGAFEGFAIASDFGG